MSHSIIEPLEFEALTGFPVTTENADRFEILSDAAVSELEQLLGWPLNPETWDNQYIEIGKSRNEWSCPSADSDDLDDPDEVEGKYRLFTAHVGDTYLAIDPAEEIHAVKVVQNGVTCKHYEDDEFKPKIINGAVQTVKYIELGKPFGVCGCDVVDDLLHIAVDADWAYSEGIPFDLKKVLAAIILEGMDVKRDVKSESVISHSYTKFDRSDYRKTYQTTLQRYAGPNGIVKRRIT